MTRSVALHASLLALALCACDPARGIGDDPADKLKVADVPYLQHVEQALRTKGLTVGELFRQRNLNFRRAPNPSGLLKQFQVDNDARILPDGEALSVLTFNVALLRAEPFGIKYAESPHMDVRGRDMPALVMSRGFDVVVLQEVWHEPDHQRFKDAAPRHGYTLLSHDRSEYTDGLLILVRDAIRDTSVEAKLVDHVPYTSQDPKEFWPGPRVKRGYVYATFQHRRLGRIHVFGTHMQAFPDQWLGRMTQSRELGLRAAEEVPDGDIGIVAGDMNSGPYYRDDSWTGPNGRDTGDWYRNAVAYGLLGYYGGMVDALAAAQEAQDVFLGDTVVNNWRHSTSIPGSVEGWCAGNPDVVFTATDCNALYFEQYAGTEYPARLDHVWLRDRSQRVHVVGAGLEFTGTRQWSDGETYEVSDHYGVGVSLLVRP